MLRRLENQPLSAPVRGDSLRVLSDLENVLAKAVRVAREFGAKRLLPFGSGLENPTAARDLDVACAGVPGWKLFELASALEETMGIPLDLVPLDPPTPFTRLMEKRARVLLAPFYSGIENILKRVSRFHGVELPAGDNWHLDLCKLGFLGEKSRLEPR